MRINNAHIGVATYRQSNYSVRCHDSLNAGAVEIQWVLVLVVNYVVLPNTAVKNVKRMTYSDTKLNAYQLRSSEHVRLVEKVVQILEHALDATKPTTVMQIARKTIGKDTRSIVWKQRSR